MALRRRRCFLAALGNVVVAAACGDNKLLDVDAMPLDVDATPLNIDAMTLDVTAPAAGEAISIADVTATSVNVTWGAANDNINAAAVLQYKIVRAASAAEIDSLAEVAAITGGSALVVDFTAATTSVAARALAPATAYAFAVVVRDLADNQAIYAPATTTTATLDVVINVAAGGDHTCAVRGDASVKCWGNNDFGQLGLGDTSERGDQAGQMGDALPAVDFGAGRSAVAIAAGGRHTCALLDDASVKCWGGGADGQLGLGDTSERGAGPGEMGDALPAVDLGAGRSAVAITARAAHSCALLDDASVKCWGSNEYGQLGLGDTSNRGTQPGEMGDALPAVDLGAGRSAVGISAGFSHTCALLDDASVKCWGSNDFGELGLGDTTYRGDHPAELGDALPAVDLGAGRSAVAIAGGQLHTCAVLDDASIKCWGYNAFGQLGLGDTTSRGDGPGEMGIDLPDVDLGAGRSAVALATGHVHTCAVLDDASMKCWGFGFKGPLGLGDSTTRGDGPGEMGDALPAVDLGTGRSAVGLTGGQLHTCGILDDASLRCWGNSEYGQLGLGDVNHRGDGPDEMGDALPVVDL